MCRNGRRRLRRSSGRAYVNLGTALVSGSYGRNYAHHRAFRTEIAVADEGYIYETCMRSGTFMVDWLTREVLRTEPGKQKEVIAALEAEAAASPIGANGVVMVPYWQGCMTPFWDSAARGVIGGLSGSTRRGDIYRALLEGLVLEQATCTMDVERATGTTIDHFRCHWRRCCLRSLGADPGRRHRPRRTAVGDRRGFLARRRNRRGQGWRLD